MATIFKYSSRQVKIDLRAKHFSHEFATILDYTYRMCALFTVKVQPEYLSLDLGVRIPENLKPIDSRFLPYQTAPVFVEDKGLRLTGMNFSLVPSWSKEAKVKFATHNARIETVVEKPTWRVPFESKHCIVPMSGFFESVYEGPLAGHVIQFVKPDHNLLFAAGIFDFWKNKTEPEKSFFSFSILTTTPTKFIEDNGHDRSPIFLDFSDAKTWSTMKEAPQNMVDFLLTKNQKPELTVQIDRPLKAGWEKRK